VDFIASYSKEYELLINLNQLSVKIYINQKTIIKSIYR
jgi:hypothetical protein